MRIIYHKQDSLVYSSLALENKQIVFSMSNKQNFGHIIGIASFYKLNDINIRSDKRLQLLKEMSKIFKIYLQKASCSEVLKVKFSVFRIVEMEIFRKFLLEQELEKRGEIVSKQASFQHEDLFYENA